MNTARLPDDIQSRFETAFERYEVRQRARNTNLVNAGAATSMQMEILEYDDGSFDLLVPVETYDDNPNLIGVPDRETAIENQLDGPVCIDYFGGDTSWTALVEDDGQQYIIENGIHGLLVNDDPRPVTGLSDAEYQSAVDTYAAVFCSGNKDMNARNVITSESTYYFIDHDRCDVLEYNRYTRKADVAESLWTDVRAKIRTIAAEFTATALPRHISTRRRETIIETLGSVPVA